MNKALAYIHHDMRFVDGWLHPISAAVIAKLCTGGKAAEIGVHHGKLFILLSLLAEHAYAVDVFDAALNLDHSGDGNRGIFEANMQRYGGAYTILQTDSALLTADSLPRIRLFSVDGSHTADMTEHDLRLAAQVLEPGGIVILDDYFNEQWPDVSVGANRVIADATLTPFAITPGKLLLSNADAHRYLEILAEEPAFVGVREMAGASVALVSAPRRARLSRIIRSPMYRAIKDQPWFSPVKRIGRRLFS